MQVRGEVVGGDRGVLFGDPLGFSCHGLFRLEGSNRFGKQTDKFLVLESLLGYLISGRVEGQLHTVCVVS